MNTVDSIAENIKSLPGDAKENIRRIVAAAWPGLPSYTTLCAPVVEEVQKATVGTGVVMTFKEHGIHKAVVVKAGTHYESPRYTADPAVPTYMISGGFINLTDTPGTALTPPSPGKAEDPRVGAVREVEEEMVDDQGKPVLTVDPSRLRPMDTKTLFFPKTGEHRLVIGFHLELTPEEAATVKAHVARLEGDEAYRRAVRAHTENEETGKPEICTISILPLKEIAEGRHKLLHPDQRSLFQRIGEALAPARSFSFH